MIPGELLVDGGDIDLNPGRRRLTLVVENGGDRPIQVGSHYHFAETNGALRFDRAAARGMRLDIASGTAVRFEPGQQRTVSLVELAGARVPALSSPKEAMIPGELLTDDGDIDLNPGRRRLTLVVENGGDRPIQVGSHYHFAETNGALRFDREAARGMRLDIASGTAVRFEPGQQRTVQLVEFAGTRTVYGFRGLVQGKL